jgi:hypothetical protein
LDTRISWATSFTVTKRASLKDRWATLVES